MSNNGQFGSHMYQQQSQDQEQATEDYSVANDVKKGLMSAWGYAAQGALAMKQKADESGLTDKAKGAANTTGSYLSSAASYTATKSQSAYEQAKESETL